MLSWIPLPAFLVVGAGVYWAGVQPPGLAQVAVVFMIAVVAAPFMMLGSMVGGPIGGYVCFGMFAVFLALAPLVTAVMAGARTPDRLSRWLTLNLGVGWLIVPGGLLATFIGFSNAWP